MLGVDGGTMEEGIISCFKTLIPGDELEREGRSNHNEKENKK